MNAGAGITGRWAQQIVDAVDGRTNESGIRAALGAVGERFDMEAFAKVIEDELLRGTMLGVLDVDWEVEHEDEIGLVKFAPTPGAESQPAAHAPFTEAIADFRNRNIMPRPAFDLLERDARRKAFTVARLTKQELLDTAHAELLRQLENSGGPTRKDPETGKWIYEGPNFREFKTFVKDRLESAGWTPANPSHVETIFRTNVMSAYAGGRHAQMSSPAVVARMPYWQIRGVDDSRQRPTHHAAVGILLPADHPFWKRAYPPFGYNCRCRVVARSQRWVDANSATIGPEPKDLPDPGFDSGTNALPAIPPAMQAQPPAATPSAPAPLPPIATQSGPRFPPGGLPVSIPFEGPRPPDGLPLEPLPPVPATPPLQARAKEFSEALKLEDGGKQARELLRAQIQDTFPGAIARGRGLQSDTLVASGVREDPNLRNANAYIIPPGFPDSGRIVARKARVALAKKAAKLLSGPPITGKLGPADSRLEAIDGLRTLVHEEMHGHSRVSKFSYHGLGMVLEEVGNELSAQRVIARLFPAAELEGRFTALQIGAYPRQVKTVVGIVQQATGKTEAEARNLVVEAHHRGILSQHGMFHGKEEAIQAFLGALEVTGAELQAIRDGLTAAI